MPEPLFVAHPIAPKDPMYLFAGMSRSIVGVEAPEPGVDAIDASDSVRLSVFRMEGCACGRGWKMEAVACTGAEFHDPSRYKLIAMHNQRMSFLRILVAPTSLYIVATDILQLLQSGHRQLSYYSLKHANIKTTHVSCIVLSIGSRFWGYTVLHGWWRGLRARRWLFGTNLNWRRIFSKETALLVRPLIWMWRLHGVVAGVLAVQQMRGYIC
jgi:hypothetical protein